MLMCVRVRVLVLCGGKKKKQNDSLATLLARVVGILVSPKKKT
jgi:hypothetical protein